MYLCIKDNKFKHNIEKNCIKVKDGIYLDINIDGFNKYTAIDSSIDIYDNNLEDGTCIDIYVIKQSQIISIAKIRKEFGVWQRYGTENEYKEVLGKSVTDKEYEEVNKIINTILNTNNITIEKNKVEILVSYLEYKDNEVSDSSTEEIKEDEFGIADMAFSDISMYVESLVEKVYSTSKMKFSTIINELKQLASNGFIDRIVVTQDNTYLIYAENMLESPKIKVSTFGDITDTFVKIYEMNKEG